MSAKFSEAITEYPCHLPILVCKLHINLAKNSVTNSTVMNFDKHSRRNFLKTTSVLAVGAASVSLFSGLVYANEDYLYMLGPCVFLAKEDPNSGQPFLECYYQCRDGWPECQTTCWAEDENGIWSSKTVDSRFNTSRATSVVCDSVFPPGP